jgi:hypothetical protein
MRHAIFALALTSLLASCATSPTQLADSRVPPAKQLLQGYSAASVPTPGAVKITVVRDSGNTGRAGNMKLSIDGLEIATLDVKERVDLYVQPGARIFALQPVPTFLGSAQESTQQIGEDYPKVFRISMGPGGWSLQPTTLIR